MQEQQAEQVRYRVAFEGTISSEKIPELIATMSDLATTQTVSLEFTEGLAATAVSEEAAPQYNERYVFWAPGPDGTRIATVTESHFETYELDHTDPSTKRAGIGARTFGVLTRRLSTDAKERFCVGGDKMTVGLAAEHLDELIFALSTENGQRALGVYKNGLGAKSVAFMKEFADAALGREAKEPQFNPELVNYVEHEGKQVAIVREDTIERFDLYPNGFNDFPRHSGRGLVARACNRIRRKAAHTSPEIKKFLFENDDGDFLGFRANEFSTLVEYLTINIHTFGGIGDAAVELFQKFAEELVKQPEVS